MGISSWAALHFGAPPRLFSECLATGAIDDLSGIEDQGQSSEPQHHQQHHYADDRGHDIDNAPAFLALNTDHGEQEARQCKDYLASELLANIPSDEILEELFRDPTWPQRKTVTHLGLKILKLRLEGFDTAQIAERLHMTHYTIFVPCNGCGSARLRFNKSPPDNAACSNEWYQIIWSRIRGLADGPEKNPRWGREDWSCCPVFARGSLLSLNAMI